MDTFITRQQKAFTKFTFAISIATVVIAILNILHLKIDGAYSVPARFKVLNSQLKLSELRRHGASYRSPQQCAVFRFNAQTDLTPLFNWNTKQVFTYITIDYNTTNPQTKEVRMNSVVIWDDIIVDKEKAKFTLSRKSGKYYAFDVDSEFRPDNGEVEFKLHWNVQPRVGFLSYGTAVSKRTTVSVVDPPKRPDGPEN